MNYLIHQAATLITVFLLMHWQLTGLPNWKEQGQ
jgi:hypothetical protein